MHVAAAAHEGKCLLLFFECRFCDQLLFLVRQVPYNPYKADIFATGVSLFLMLSEKYPLQQTTDQEVILTQQQRDYPQFLRFQ